ncbi:MAG: HAD family acid phosphatase [Acidobacteriota bacterium]
MSAGKRGRHHNNVNAMLWQDISAERDALYLQCFALARMRVEQALAERGSGEGLCVFTDCDETLIDNSAYNAWLIHTGRDYHVETWNRYCQAQICEAKPGAVEFSNFLREVGIPLFFVTTRADKIRAATAANLRELGFPVSDADADRSPENCMSWRLFLRGSRIDGVEVVRKYDQYRWIMQHHGLEPILWLGDSLADFAPDYDVETEGVNQHTRRAAARGPHVHHWGERWIVMPNPTYGDWLKTLKDDQGQVIYDDQGSASRSFEPVRDPVSVEECPKLGMLKTWDEEG